MPKCFFVNPCNRFIVFLCKKELFEAKMQRNHRILSMYWPEGNWYLLTHLKYSSIFFCLLFALSWYKTSLSMSRKVGFLSPFSCTNRRNIWFFFFEWEKRETKLWEIQNRFWKLKFFYCPFSKCSLYGETNFCHVHYIEINLWSKNSVLPKMFTI